MKKRWLAFLMALCLVLTGCGAVETVTPSADAETEPVITQPVEDNKAKSEEESETKTEVSDPILEEYLTHPEILETPVRDYGESVSLMEMDEHFVARILYPEGGLSGLDQAVANWAAEKVELYRAEAGKEHDEPAELTVDYCSYLVDGYVSVYLTGIYDEPYLAHPIDLSASFNADSTTGEIISLDHLLLNDGRDALHEMVIRDGGIDAADVDDALLDHWLLTPEGLEITLVRGDYLPMSSGTVILCYPYADLEGILSLEGSTAPEEMTEEPAVIPEEVPEVSVPDPNRPMLALTFDDGPSKHTERLLDIFAANGGKGTFYVVGNMLDSRPDALRRMAAEGHEIGGHSWNHRQLTKLDENELTDQFMSTRAKIYEITGSDPITMRPPYGSFNDAVKAKAKELGITMINWSVDTLDWKHKDADVVYKAVIDGAKDGAIILCHDLHKTTVDAMERAIPDLLAQGYQLVTVTELLTADGETLAPGTVHFKK